MYNSTMHRFAPNVIALGEKDVDHGSLNFVH
jgi:hypothetical protein